MIELVTRHLLAIALFVAVAVVLLASFTLPVISDCFTDMGPNGETVCYEHSLFGPRGTTFVLSDE